MSVNLPATRSQSGGSRGLNLTLRDIVIILYRRKWLILAIMLPIVLAGGYALMNQASSYWATARVLVELANVEQPRWNANRNIDYDRELSTLFNIAMSVSVAELAADSLEDSIPVIRASSPVFAELQTTEELTEILLGSTNVAVIGESRILEFQVNAPEPRLALMWVEAMRDAFVKHQVSGRKNSKAITYYEEQIGVVRARVDSLLHVRAGILMESGYTEETKQLGYEAARLIEVKKDLMEARSARQVMEVRHRSLVKALDGDPRDFPMGVEESRSVPLVRWQGLAIDHEDKLNTLLSAHTANSIPVVQQKELLANVLENLRREQRSYVAQVEIELQQLLVSEELLDQQVKEYESRQAQAPLTFYRISAIDKETLSMRDLMRNLQDKLGEVRLTSQADERVSDIISLTNPTLSTLISSGKSLIYFVILVLFATALGIIIAFVLEMLDHRVSSAQDINEHLQLPVFAYIRKVE